MVRFLCKTVQGTYNIVSDFSNAILTIYEDKKNTSFTFTFQMTLNMTKSVVFLGFILTRVTFCL